MVFLDVDSGECVIAMWDPSLSGAEWPGLVQSIKVEYPPEHPYYPNVECIWPHTSIRTGVPSSSDALELNLLGSGYDMLHSTQNDGSGMNFTDFADINSYIYGIRPRGHDPIYLKHGYEGLSGSQADWFPSTSMNNSRGFLYRGSPYYDYGMRCQVSWKFNGQQTILNKSSNRNMIRFGCMQSISTSIQDLSSAAALTPNDFQTLTRGWPDNIPMNMFKNNYISSAQGYSDITMPNLPSIRAIQVGIIEKNCSAVFMPVIIVSHDAPPPWGDNVVIPGYSDMIQFCFQFSLYILSGQVLPWSDKIKE